MTDYFFFPSTQDEPTLIHSSDKVYEKNENKHIDIARFTPPI